MHVKRTAPCTLLFTQFISQNEIRHLRHLRTAPRVHSLTESLREHLVSWYTVCHRRTICSRADDQLLSQVCCMDLITQKSKGRPGEIQQPQGKQSSLCKKLRSCRTLGARTISQVLRKHITLVQIHHGTMRSHLKHGSVVPKTPELSLLRVVLWMTPLDTCLFASEPAKELGYGPGNYQYKRCKDAPLGHGEHLPRWTFSLHGGVLDPAIRRPVFPETFPRNGCGLFRFLEACLWPCNEHARRSHVSSSITNQYACSLHYTDLTTTNIWTVVLIKAKQ